MILLQAGTDIPKKGNKSWSIIVIGLIHMGIESINSDMCLRIKWNIFIILSRFLYICAKLNQLISNVI